jgi:hypothetical protein
MRQVLYAVYGDERHFTDARRSAASVKLHNSDTSTLAYTGPETAAMLDRTIFDEVRVVSFEARSDLRLDFVLKLHAIRDGLTKDSGFPGQ